MSLSDHDSSGSPLVSIIIPTYNYGRFLADAVESIRRQTVESREIIVVDDGSTDETQAVLEERLGRKSAGLGDRHFWNGRTRESHSVSVRALRTPAHR